MKFLLLLFLLPLSLSQVQGEELEEKAEFTLHFILGVVEVKRADAPNWIPAKLGMILSPKDELRTGVNSRAEIKVGWKSIVKVRPNTHIRINQLKVSEPKDRWDASLTLWIGKIWVRFKKLTGREGALEVVTPTAVAGVRGTTFAMGAGFDGTTWLFVFDGEVFVRGVGFLEKIRVAANQKTVIYPAKQPTAPQPITPEEWLEWAEEEEKLRGEKERKEEEELRGEEEKVRVEEVKKAGEEAFSLDGEYGAVIVEGKTWTRISLQPDFRIGKFGIGLELDLLFDEEGKLREEDWDELVDSLRKIRYISYGRKGVPLLYLRVGCIPSSTIGHGFIVKSYTNMAKYPDVKRIGLELDLNFKNCGFESLVADFFGYKYETTEWIPKGDDLYERKIVTHEDKVKLYAARAFYRPLRGAILSNLIFGCTLASDLEHEVYIYGVDVEFPIGGGFYLYSDFAKIKDYGHGIISPGLGKRFERGVFKIEYRRISDRFIPSYFDTLYDIQRATKRDTVKDMDGGAGLYGEFIYKFANLASFACSYEDYKGKDNGVLYARLDLLSQMAPKISEASIFYMQNQINLKDFKFKSKNSTIEARIGYLISPNLITLLIYKLTYDEEGKEIRSTSITTKIKF